MNRRSLKLPLLGAVSLVVLLLSACGGSASPEAAQPTSADQGVQLQVEISPTPPPETPASTEPAIDTSRRVSSLSDVRKAVVQVESQGNFMDPEESALPNRAGIGSGFIIDPSGIAVTSSSVVNGAEQVQVRIAGESEPRSARVVGLDECSNLAVIEVDGQDFSYLDWYGDRVQVGTDIYVAGFSLDSPEFSLNKGIISNAQVDGKTGWGSVETLMEYDATANPGNQGGPVISQDARVVGLHQAYLPSAGQSYGLAGEQVRELVERIRSGEAAEGAGINGQAVVLSEGAVQTGVWVSAVQPSSAADQAGLTAGDVLLSLQDQELAVDGTLTGYCEILRSRASGEPLDVEVLRRSSSEILQGQLYGDPLVTASLVEGEGPDHIPAQPGVVGPNFEASASGDVYYSNEFEAPLIGDWSYFTDSGTGETDEGFIYGVDSSRLKFDIERKNTYVYFLYNQMELTDVRMDTLVENLGRNTNNVTLICRYSDKGWYEFSVFNNGEYAIWFYDAVDQQRYLPLFTGGSLEINTGKDLNEITAICEGNQLSLTINGVAVRTVTDDRLVAGLSGLGVASFEILPIIVEFDHFILSVP